MGKRYDLTTYLRERERIIDALEAQERALDAHDNDAYERAVVELKAARRDLAVSMKRNSLPGGPR